MSIVHCFWFNELFMFAGNDVIAISSLGASQVISDHSFWKGDPDFIFMFNWHFMSILNGLDVIQLFYLVGISLLVAKVWVFLGKMTHKTSNERKILAGRALPYAKLRLFSHCAWNYLYPFGLCSCARNKKAVKQEVRQEEKSQEVYISRMCGATPSRRITTKLGTCVRLTDVIKRAKFHRYNLRGFGAVRCWSFHVAIGNQGRS